MAPVLIVMYVRLAGQEDVELATVFGEEYFRYTDRTPGFIPWGRRGIRREVPHAAGGGAPGRRLTS
jgi:hypothetical protein